MSITTRRRCLVLVLIALVWAWGFPSALQPSVQGLAHELVHLQSVAHHHHDDASLHLDDVTAGEPSHQHAGDGAKPVPWHLPTADARGPLPPHPMVAATEPHSLSVVLDEPLRPPRG